MALAPAVVMTSISAFEGFVEEFVAVVGAKRGLSFAQIAKLAHYNSPSLKEFEQSLVSQLGSWRSPDWRPTWSLAVNDPPTLGSRSTWWGSKTLTWGEALDAAEGWLQVRHLLSHGLTRGYLPEVWPGPMKTGVAASDVLRPQSGGRHSLTFHGAISCARVFRHGAEALSEQAALLLGERPPRWRAVPEFNM